VRRKTFIGGIVSELSIACGRSDRVLRTDIDKNWNQVFYREMEIAFERRF